MANVVEGGFLRDETTKALVTTSVSGGGASDTELPAATADADNFDASAANAPHIKALSYVFDGTNWDRARGDSANGVKVDIGRSVAIALDAATLAALESITIGTALPAGTNNIGDVDVLTLPAGTVAGGSSLPAGTNNIGDVDVLTLPAGTVAGGSSLPAGTNNIGDVDVLTLPALPAGTNNIGDVDVLTLPAGTVAGGSSLPAGTNNIGDVDVLTLPALPAGSNVIGKVGHDSTGLGDGRTTVTTAGTRVALASTTAAKWVTITAETDNTGLVVAGSAANVVAALATRRGTPLGPGESVTFLVDDLADVGLDAMVSTDGVTYTYGT